VLARAPEWLVAGTGDFNGDRRGDILWRYISGDVAIWLMNGTTVQSSALVGNAPPAWTIQGTNADRGWRHNKDALAAVHESANGTKRRFAAAH
jgi:hypothetical protein